MSPVPAPDMSRTDARSLRLHVVPSSRVPALGGELEALAATASAPFTTSKEWIRATCAAADPDQTWAVIVRDHQGQLGGAVVVLDRFEGDHFVVTLADAHLGFRGSILASDARVAALLGYGLRRQLQYRGAPSVVVLGPIAQDTVGLPDFCTNLGDAELADDDPVPLLLRSESAVAGDYLSASMRRTLRKAGNRLTSDGRTPHIEFTDRADVIRALVPVLLRLHVRRDHSRGIPSSLDHPTNASIWQSRLLGMVGPGGLELGTLRIDDELAAYVLTVRTGETLNVLEGVLDPDWLRYAPGRLLETALLQRMLDDPTLTVLDWTSPFAPESLLAANGSTATSVVLSTAVPVLASATSTLPAPRAAHETLHRSPARAQAANAS